MVFKIKISRNDISYGPQQPDEFVAVMLARTLVDQGYRRVSNAYCRVARIDREDWLDVLAKERHCSRADFYNVDGSGIGDQHRDHYIRCYSNDFLTVAPEILRHVPSY